MFETLITAAALLAGTPPCMLPADHNSVMLSPMPESIDVPTNATIVVKWGDEAPSPRLLDSTGAELAAAIEESALNTGSPPAWPILRMVPNALLPVGERVSLVRGDETVSWFFVGSATSDEAPLAPGLELVGPYTEGACPPLIELSLDPGEGSTLHIAKLDADPSLPGDIDGFSMGRQLVVVGPALWRGVIRVRSMDVAGNLSEASEIEVTFPAEYPWGCACSSTSGSPATAPLWLMASLAVMCARPFARRR